jgi:uncharacterized protein YndB with AHSA1/START domain
VILATCDRVVDAPVDVIWPLISTAEGLNEWMSVVAEVDLRTGGTIRWTHANGWVVAGELLEIVPHRRLVFTYGWESGGFPVPVGSSVVTIELDPLGAATRVRVRHEGLSPSMAEQHTKGWAMFVDRLAVRVGTGGAE